MMTYSESSKSVFPTNFCASLYPETTEAMKQLDGITYKVWHCLNVLRDSKAKSQDGYLLGVTMAVSQQNIANRTNLPRETVNRCLKKLRDSGKVRTIKAAHGVFRYQLMSFIHAINERREPVSENHAPQVTPPVEIPESEQGVIDNHKGCDEPSHRLDSPNRFTKDSLSSPVPAKEEVIKGKDSNEREKDLCDLFYEHALGKTLVILDGGKRKSVNARCGQLVKSISRHVGIENAKDVLIDAFCRVRGYDPYSFGIMSADYGERCIESAINAHLSATTAENVATLPHTASNECEPCDTLPEPETNAHKPKLSVEDRIRYHLAAMRYRDIDHAVSILQRKDNTLAREDIIRVLKECENKPKPLLKRLSPHAIIESVGNSLSADVMGALAHLQGMRTAPVMGG